MIRHAPRDVFGVVSKEDGRLGFVMPTGKKGKRIAYKFAGDVLVGGQEGGRVPALTDVVRDGRSFSHDVDDKPFDGWEVPSRRAGGGEIFGDVGEDGGFRVCHELIRLLEPFLEGFAEIVDPCLVGEC